MINQRSTRLFVSKKIIFIFSTLFFSCPMLAMLSGQNPNRKSQQRLPQNQPQFPSATSSTSSQWVPRPGQPVGDPNMQVVGGFLNFTSGGRSMWTMDDYKRVLPLAEEQMKQLKQQLLRHQADIDSWKKTAEQHQSDAVGAKSQQNLLQKTNAELQQQLTSLQRQLERQIADLQLQLQNEKKAGHDESSRLQSLLEQKQNERQEVISQLAEQHQEVVALRNQLEDQHAAFVQLQENKTELQSLVDRLQQEQQELQQRLQLENTLKQSEIAAVKVELEMLRESKEAQQRLLEEATKLREQGAAELKQKLEAHIQELNQRRADLEVSLQQQLQQLKSAEQNLAKADQEKQRELASARDRIEQLQAVNEQQLKEAEDLRQENARCLAKLLLEQDNVLERLQQQKQQEINSVTEQLQKEIQQLQQTIGINAARFTALQAQNYVLEQQRAALEKALQEGNVDAAELLKEQQNRRQLETQLAEIQQEKDELTTQLLKEHQELVALKQQLETGGSSKNQPSTNSKPVSWWKVGGGTIAGGAGVGVTGVLLTALFKTINQSCFKGAPKKSFGRILREMFTFKRKTPKITARSAVKSIIKAQKVK